ncbi:vomeronasal type-2 receptor 26-like [Dendropsophus ebraccatus]|uniref:vomeronasal type-2 receptor 26-like n=1 Tax=Dendropsophus ebraccatus TaxID=150705 RepID=UPI0038316548
MLPHAVGSLKTSTCSLQSPLSPHYYQEGDLLIGGIITVMGSKMQMEFQFDKRPLGTLFECRIMNLRTYQNLLAFVFAIKEINENPYLLPNISLGFQVIDPCFTEGKALIGMFDILSGIEDLVLNYRCGNIPNLIGFLDGMSSKISIMLIRIFGFYNIPQISYSTMDSLLSDKAQFPSFYRTVPNENVQFQAIAKLIQYFGWTWIGIFVPDNESGLKASQALQKELAKSNACVAFLEFLPYHDSLNERKKLDIVETLRTTLATVIIAYGDKDYMFTLQIILYIFPIPEKLHKYLKKISFTNNVGGAVQFDEHGDMRLGFDVLNWIVFPNESLHAVKVGQFDPSSSNQLLINKTLIRWSPTFNQTPNSTCSETCLPGYRKSSKKSSSSCCYICVPCSEGEISNNTNMDVCSKCPITEWPNEEKAMCIPKVVTYLSYEEPLGTCLALASVTLFMMTCSVTVIFLKYRNTPVVKANNRDLSYILLLSLKMCFLCPFLFIGLPTNMACLLRRPVFGITFTIAVSSILAKTIVVFIAFNATRPGGKLNQWIKSRWPNCIVLFCTMFQFLICVFWLGKSPPFPYYNMADNIGEILAECKDSSFAGLYCVLGYMGILAIASFILAFLARNLPDIFNEAKFITFSMLVFCSVWMSFIPAYLSSKGKYVVAVEIFAILTSSAGLLGLIFLPKCYIILIRSDQNVIKHLKRNDK